MGEIMRWIKLRTKKNSFGYSTIYFTARRIRGFITFPRVFVWKWMEFKLAYNDSTVKRFNHYTMGTPPSMSGTIDIYKQFWWKYSQHRMCLLSAAHTSHSFLCPCTPIYIYIYISLMFTVECFFFVLMEFLPTPV